MSDMQPLMKISGTQFTRDMQDALIKYWQVDELSCSQIADALRQEFPQYPGTLNRNVIIGKITRLRDKGVPLNKKFSIDTTIAREKYRKPRHMHFLKPKEERPARVRPAKVVHVPRKIRKTTALGSPADYVPEQPKHFRDAFVPAPSLTRKHVEIMGLRAGLCRWPIDIEGETSQHYCSAPCELTSSYCTHHYRLGHAGYR